MDQRRVPMLSFRLRPAIYIIVCWALFLAACQSQTRQGSNAKTYAFHGTVVSVDAKSKTANIKGDAVKGWMEAMTMDYPVPESGDLAQLKPGLEFKADLVVTGDEYSLHHVSPAGAAPTQ